MPQSWIVKDEEQRQALIAYVCNMDLSKPKQFEIKEANRSSAQNNAMYLWFGQVAAVCNEAGQDMRKVLKPEVDIPWTKQSVHDYMAIPIAKAMFGYDSTKDLKKTEVSDVCDTLSRHLGTKIGVTLPPFPSQDI